MGKRKEIDQRGATQLPEVARVSWACTNNWLADRRGKMMAPVNQAIRHTRPICLWESHYQLNAEMIENPSMPGKFSLLYCSDISATWCGPSQWEARSKVWSNAISRGDSQQRHAMISRSRSSSRQNRPPVPKAWIVSTKMHAGETWPRTCLAGSLEKLCENMVEIRNYAGFITFAWPQVIVLRDMSL